MSSSSSDVSLDKIGLQILVFTISEPVTLFFDTALPIHSGRKHRHNGTKGDPRDVEEIINGEGLSICPSCGEDNVL